MAIQKLWTVDYKNESLQLKQLEYNVINVGDLTHVTRNNGGWYFLYKSWFDRMFGETPTEVISQQRKWLIEKVLPEKIAELKNITDEIEALSEWLNENC
jgi:hypothetical protein